MGQAKYGLAQVAYAQGDISTARQQAQESLAILEEMAHDEAIQVKEWLRKLSSPGTKRKSKRHAALNRVREVAMEANKRLNVFTMPSPSYNWGLV